MSSSKRLEVRLQHILNNIDGVTKIAAGHSIDEITDNFLLIRATERAFQINSEAAKELTPAVRNMEPDVSWKNIIGFGNLLRHEYYRIDAGVLDDILRNELPILREAVLRLLKRVDR